MSQMMTLDEKLSTIMKSIELEKAGDKEGADKLSRTVPIPFYIAKIMKEKIGADYLINGGWNLAEAEEKFGKDWLVR